MIAIIQAFRSKSGHSGFHPSGVLMQIRIHTDKHPLVVTHHAGSAEAALPGSVEKLKRILKA